MINPFYKKNNVYFLLILALVFLTLFAMFGVVRTNDSWAFLETSPAVSPLYALCVSGFVSLLGENAGLSVLVVIQELMAAYAIFSLTVSLTKRFQLRTWIEIVIAGIFVGAYILRLIMVGKEALYCNTIMSEAFAYPFYFMFLKYAFFAYDNLDYKCLLYAIMFSFLMALTRGQLINTAIVIVILFFVIYRKRKQNFILLKKHTVLKAIFVAILYGIGVWLFSCLFHYVASGSFLPTTMGSEAVLGNVLYNSQVSDAEILPEEDNIRNVYTEAMKKAETDCITYLSAPSGFIGKFKHYEQSHDTVRHYLSDTLKKYDPSLDSESIRYAVGTYSGHVLMLLLKKNLGPYLKNCVINMMGGMVRSNSILSSMGVLLSVIIYTICIAFLAIFKRKKMLSGERKLLKVVLLIMVVNCAFCSFGVFELSRYVYYSFPCIYATLLICFIGVVSNQRKTKENVHC